MDVILFNPLSRNGKGQKSVEKLSKQLLKQKREFRLVNILEITNIHDFIEENQVVDRFIIIGGDGTLNKLINEVKRKEIIPDICLYRSGTGNDFARSIKHKKGIVSIKEYLRGLPTVSFNDQEKYFLNGVGLGLDGLTVSKVNNSRFRKNKLNYFRHALEAFREHKPGKITIDTKNQTIIVDKAWLVVVMNDKYLGGGMKIAPKANRNNEMLNVVIIKDAPRYLVPFLMPTIYLGIHTMFKKYVKVIETKEVTITSENSTFMQMDGEDYNNINKIIVKKEKNK